MEEDDPWSLLDGLGESRLDSRRRSTKETMRDEGIRKLVEEEIQLRKFGVLTKDSAAEREELGLLENHKLTVATIEASLNGSDVIAQKMIQKLEIFDGRLDNTIQSIQQIQMEIRQHEKKREDINRTIVLVEDILQIFSQIGYLSQMINSPSFKTFIQGYDKLLDAIEFLKDNTANIGVANSLEECNKLYSKFAIDNLMRHFRDKLELTNQLNLQQYRDMKVELPEKLSLFPEKIIDDLEQLISRMMLNQKQETIITYVATRKEYLRELLVSAFDLRPEGAEKIQQVDPLPMKATSSRTSLSMPITLTKLQDAQNRDSRDSMMGLKPISVLKQSKTIQPECFTKLVIPPESAGGAALVYQPGSCQFFRFIDTFVALIQSERETTLALFPDDGGEVFAKEILDIIEIFGEGSDSVLKTLQSHPNCVWAINVLLDFLTYQKTKARSAAQISALSPAFSQRSERGKENLNQTIMACLEYFLEKKTTEKLTPLPADGTVHSLTTMVINYTTQLLKYEPIINLNKLINFKNHTMHSLADFIRSCLQSLKKNIDSTRKPNVLSCIFELNNCYFIWKKLKTSELILVGPDYVKTWEQAVLQQKDIYFTCWEKCLGAIGDNFKPTKHLGITVNLSTQIKERFTIFNAQLQWLFETQKVMYIPDEELREQMKEEIRAKMKCAYLECKAKYEKVNFCKEKNKTKYLTYTAETLEDMICQFFEGKLKQ